MYREQYYTVQYPGSQFYRKTYRKKMNIPKYLTEQNRNSGLLPSIEKYWKVTKILTGGCQYWILHWAILFFQSLICTVSYPSYYCTILPVRGYSPVVL